MEQGGPMVPVAGAGVIIAKDAATVVAGQVAITTTGRWSDRTHQSVTIRYQNKGGAPASIAMTGLSSHRGGDSAPLESVADSSKASGPNYDPDKDLVMLYDQEDGQPARPLEVPAGGVRTVSVEFGPVATGQPLASGQTVVLTIPTLTGTTPVSFTTKAE
jgi:hypothetical protein